MRGGWVERGTVLIKLTRAHFAFFRGALEGLEPGCLARRYLETAVGTEDAATDARIAQSAVVWIRTQLLIAELQAGKIKPTEIDPAQTNRLTGSSDAGIREAAAKILGSSTPEDRKKALADYQAVLALTGDARKGQAIFTKNCITCHKIGDLGVNVAPDISDSRTKTAAQLLGDIIQPNRAIDANYVAYLLVTTDGTTASGILAAETSTSISLKAPGNKIITIPRSEIDQLRSTGLSLMPEGLEKTISQQEMADLLAFIKNWRYLDGQIPGLGK